MSLLLGCSEKSTEANLDGFTADIDCDDDPNIFPGALEYCDNIDNNCNDLIDDLAVDQCAWYWDYDGDGLGDKNGRDISACPNSNPE